MQEISKKEIWNALIKYNQFFDCLVSHPDEKIGNLLFTVHNEDTKDIVKTKNINIMMESLEYLSNIENDYFKSINNTDIGTDIDKKTLFEKPSEAKKFSWKLILKNIQICFKENSKTKYYKLYEEGDILECVNEEATPIPFHIKIEMKPLLLMIQKILHTEYYYSYSSLHFEEGEFHEICLKDRWNINSEKDYIDLRVANKTYKEQDEDYIELLKKNKLDYEIKKYKLLPEQLNAYQAILEHEKTDYMDKFIMKTFINYYSPSIMPLKGIKTFFNMEQINMIFTLYNNPQKTFNEFMDIFKNLFRSLILNKEKTTEEEEQYVFYIEEPFRILTNTQPMIYQKYYNSAINMIEYFLSNIYKNKTIQVGEETIKKDILIKAFKENKWFLNPNERTIIHIVDIQKKNQVYQFKEKLQVDLETLFKTILLLDK